MLPHLRSLRRLRAGAGQLHRGSTTRLCVYAGLDRSLKALPPHRPRRLRGGAGQLHRGSSSEDSWEPAENLRGFMLLAEYEQARSRREAARLRRRGQR